VIILVAHYSATCLQACVDAWYTNKQDLPGSFVADVQFASTVQDIVHVILKSLAIYSHVVYFSATHLVAFRV
jgi:hypothetical protein